MAQNFKIARLTYKIIATFFILSYLYIAPAYAAGKNQSQVIITGKITDASTNQPLSAQVKVVQNKKALAKTQSDLSGNYQLKLKHSGKVIIKAELSGYKSKEAGLKIKAGKAYTINFALVPNVTDLPPKITGFIPPDSAVFYENDPVLIKPTVEDNDPSPLEYQFWVDGSIKQAWSAKDNYSWPASFGLHNLKIEVRDAGGADSKQAEIFVYKKPIAAPE